MSFDLIWNAKAGTFRSSTHLLLALTICRYTRTDGVCYAYRRTLALKSQMHIKTVQRTLADLAEDGIVKVQEIVSPSGHQSANRIWFTMQGVVDSQGPQDEIEPHDPTPEGAALPTRSARLRGKGTPRSPPGAQDSTYDNGNLTENLNGNNNGGASALITVAFNEWNDLAQAEGLPIAEKLTEDRKRKLSKRIKESGIEGWRRALAAIGCAKFLVGESRPKDGQAPFRAHIDFVLQARSFQKLVEGGYGQDRKPARAPSQDGRVQASLREGGQFARTMVSKWTQDAGSWTEDMGPAPDMPGCIVPRALLERFSFPLPALPVDGHAIAQAHAHDDLAMDAGQHDDEVPL